MEEQAGSLEVGINNRFSRHPTTREKSISTSKENMLSHIYTKEVKSSDVDNVYIAQSRLSGSQSLTG